MKVLSLLTSTIQRSTEKVVAVLRQSAHPVPTHSVSSTVATPTLQSAERTALGQSSWATKPLVPTLPMPTRRVPPAVTRRLFHTSTNTSSAHMINNAVNQTESSLTFAGVAAWQIVRKLTAKSWNSNLQTLTAQQQQHTRAYVHQLTQPRSELSKLMTRFQQQRQRSHQQHQTKHLKFGGAGSAVMLAAGLMAVDDEEYDVGHAAYRDTKQQLVKPSTLHQDIGNDHKLYESPVAHVVDDILCRKLADEVVASPLVPSFLSQMAAHLIAAIHQHKQEQRELRRELQRQERRKQAPQVIMPAWFDSMLKFNGTQLELSDRSLPSLLHWYQLSVYLRNQPQVIAVLFKNLHMKPERLQLLSDNHSFMHLQHLTIRSCSLGVYKGNVKRLVDAFGLDDNIAASSQLTSLHLDHNSLTSGDLSTLNRLLLRSPSLQTLNLSWNNLNDAPARMSLCRMLRATVGTTQLTSVNLRHNRIGSDRREIRQLQSELAAVGLQVNVEVY